MINYHYFLGPPEISMDGIHGHEYHENHETDEEFDDEVPAHRRMTVTRVADHAELADSVLSAQSAPTINITPISPKYHHQTINDVIEASVKMEQAH